MQACVLPVHEEYTCPHKLSSQVNANRSAAQGLAYVAYDVFLAVIDERLGSAGAGARQVGVHARRGQRTSARGRRGSWRLADGELVVVRAEARWRGGLRAAELCARRR